jgi:hypothetical protein
MNTTRKMGWLLTAGLVGAALVAPTAAFAQTGNQTDVSSDNYTESCTGGPGGSDITPEAGKVAWLFVHAGVDGPGTLTAEFDGAGEVTADSYIQGGVKYLIVTDAPETLVSFSDDIAGGVLTLSHVCNGAEEESASVPVESESVPVESESVPVESESIPVESESVPVESESIPVESETPSGSVDAETGTPEQEVTPPPTDTITASSTASNSGWQLVLIGLAALVATALIATPSRKRR